MERLSLIRRWGAVPVTLVECSLGGSSILEAAPRQVYADRLGPRHPTPYPHRLMWRRCSSLYITCSKRTARPDSVMFLTPSNRAGR